MGFLIASFRNLMLGHAIGSRTFTPDANLYVALSTTTIAADGSNMTEPTGNNYVRYLVPNTSTYWSDPSAGALTSLVDFVFNEATPAGWGTITDVALMTAASGGTMRAAGAMPGGSKVIAATETFRLRAGEVDFTLVNP